MAGAYRLGQVAFGGIRTINSGEKYAGAMAYATSADGNTWSIGSGGLTNTKTAYGSYGTDAVDDGGVPVVAVNAGSTDHVTLHRGIDVVGAQASFGGVTVKTNSKGKAVVTVNKHASTGKKRLTVSLRYCVARHLIIRVT